MVRPRASEQNIQIALAFADVVMVQMKPGIVSDANTVLVTRKGRQSIHAAFAACFPNLARDSHEKRPKNRQGVAVMELNKALQAAGLRSVRKRDRIDGGVRWRSKVQPFRAGLIQDRLSEIHYPEVCFVSQFWAHCRWASPSEPNDFNAVAEKLARIQEMHIQLRQCSLERVLDVISNLRRSRQPAKDSGSDSNPDSPEPSSRPADEQQLPPLARLGWPAIMSMHLPPLSIGSLATVSSPSPHAALPCQYSTRRCHYHAVVSRTLFLPAAPLCISALGHTPAALASAAFLPRRRQPAAAADCAAGPAWTTAGPPSAVAVAALCPGTDSPGPGAIASGGRGGGGAGDAGSGQGARGGRGGAGGGVASAGRAGALVEQWPKSGGGQVVKRRSKGGRLVSR